MILSIRVKRSKRGQGQQLYKTVFSSSAEAELVRIFPTNGAVFYFHYGTQPLPLDYHIHTIIYDSDSSVPQDERLTKSLINSSFLASPRRLF